LHVRSGSRVHPRWRFGLLLLLLFLPSCRIGSGFDTAEKRRNLIWDETPVQVAEEPRAPEELAPEAKQSPPIVYLLVAG
jgi:hypothetical protein